MRHVLAILSSCSYLTDIDVPVFLAYRGKFRGKAEIKRFPADAETQEFSKVVLLGTSGVGKTWLFSRLSGREPNPDEVATTACDFYVFCARIRDGRTPKLVLWDTAGQETYRALTVQYVRDCACALIVFDLSRRQSFEDLSGWVEWLRRSAPVHAQILLIAAQADCEHRQVSMEEVHAFAKGCGAFGYVEVSGRTGDNVHEIVDQIGAFVRPVPSVAVVTHVKSKRCCRL
jgi:Ras-related protein Rab-2A